MADIHDCDVAIVGGGLAGSLIALALAEKRPELSLLLIEAGEAIGGDQLWSFLDAEVAKDDRWLLTPLVSHAWPAYDVSFPGHARVLNQPVYAIEGARLERALRARLPQAAMMTGRRVQSVTATSVSFPEGDRIEARGVIDARGAGDLSALETGWRKSLARVLEVEGGHGMTRPMLMDAAVTQHDGCRFVRCLPLSDTRVFVEDGYFSDTAAINAGALNRRIEGYAESRGWRVLDSGGEERGALPLAMGGDFEVYWRAGGARVAKAGVRGGMFHPATGHALADAVRLAVRIAGAEDLSGEALHNLTHDHARDLWEARGFYRLFSAMLFRAANPDVRWRVPEHLYRQPGAMVTRFIAARSTFSDKARVLSGKRPVPFWRAVKVARRIA
ncbi:MAG: lycopene beta-cyclase CrtY [Sphingomonas bacterium]